MTSKGAPTMKRRLFSILLALCMTLAMLPAAAFAKSVSYNGEIIIENLGWLFLNNDEIGYYIPGKNGKFSVNQPNSGPYLKVTKTGENEITITVHGNVTLQGKEAISFKDANAIKSIKNLIITGTTGKDTLSLSTTKGGTTISVLGDLTVTGITLTATAGNGHALRANNITVSDATLIATNNSADSAAIQATQGDGPLGNLTVSGTSAITVTNKNATGRAIHATIINGNETPGQTDASQVTISSPAPHSHICSDGWTSDATGHWHRCTDANCTEKLNFAAHSGGTATCTAKKKCEICNQSYSEPSPSNHTDLSDWKFDETHHWKDCADCKAAGIDNAAHTLGEWIIDKEPTATEAGTKCRECSVCHYKETAAIPPVPCTHEGSTSWEPANDGEHHVKKCTDCGAIIEKAAHSGGAATCSAKKKCEVCGEPYGGFDTSNHTALSGWKFDETGHWKTCKDCGTIIEKTAHTGGAATCTEAKRCEVCDQSYGELNPSNHTDLSDWKFDETGHWKTCNDCGAIIEKTAHTGGSATCTEAKKCEVCGEPYGELDPSNHTALSDWIFDETGHWKDCADCNATGIDNAAHTFDDWIIDKEPTATEAGLKHRTCSVCHYKETATIPSVPCTHEGSTTWEPANDGVHHVKKCAACGAIIEKTAHSGGTTTCSTKKKCTICGEPYGELDPSNHTALSDWTSNETHHWKVCADCNATGIDNAAHTFGEWIIDKEATATEAGSRHKVCTICNYETQTETIPATGPCTHEGSTWVPAGDGVHHVKKCADCGAEPAIEKHNFAYCDNSDNSHTMTCDVCGEARIEPHDFSHKTVPADDGKHHGECICGAFGAVEGHTYQNGKCTACGAADPTPAKPTPGGSGIIITPEAADPAFLSGANQTVALGSTAAFRIDYSYAAFRSVAVDGVILTPADYTTWDGSTWVKLTAAYTKSLTPGTHTLSVYFDGATAATTFTVGGQPNPATGARDAVGIAAAAAVIALLGSAAVLRKK